MARESACRRSRARATPDLRTEFQKKGTHFYFAWGCFRDFVSGPCDVPPEDVCIPSFEASGRDEANRFTLAGNDTEQIPAASQRRGCRQFGTARLAIVGPFAFTVTPTVLVLGVVYALILGFVGGLLPSVRAARLPITTGLREL